MPFVVRAYCQCETCLKDPRLHECWAQSLAAPTWEFTEAQRFATREEAYEFMVALGIQHPEWKYDVQEA